MMDLVNTLLNVAAPPFSFITLCFLLPPFQLFKFFLGLLSSLFPEDVFGKVVLITGASSGIGEHIAYEYAKKGACLVLAARRDRSLREVADLCLELGSPESIVVKADVANPEDCKRIVDTTVARYGRLDHLVINAGITGVSKLEDIEDMTKMRPVMDINFWGAVYTTRYAIPYLRRTGGRIVAISSSASWLPAARESIYNASKAAMTALFETLRVELGSDVKITIVTPGLIESEFTKGKVLTKEGEMRVDQDLRDIQVNMIPVGTAQGTAQTIVNAACRGERYVTVPRWFRVTYYWKLFCPELVEWVYRLFYLATIDGTLQGVLGKKFVDMPGAKTLLYPPGIHSPEVKMA